MVVTNGTLGAALSTAIWAAIAGAAWASCVGRVLVRRHLARTAAWVLNLIGLALIIMIPQGLRLWGPGTLIQRYLPHTLTVPELSLLVKIAAIAGVAGIGVALLYRRLGSRGPSSS